MSMAHTTLKQYPKNEACSSDNIEDIRQNHCTTKYRSLTVYIFVVKLNVALNQYQYEM